MAVKQDRHKQAQRLSEILPDEEALRQLIGLHWEKLLAYCQHYTKERDASQEILQDIFCTLWDRRNATEINVPITHYLFSAARNKIARYYRDKYRDERHREHAAFLFKEETHNTEETIHHQDMQRRISELVNRLPERCGEVYVLSRDEGMAIREIAGKLSISEKTVETHLTKALKFLRRHLRGERHWPFSDWYIFLYGLRVIRPQVELPR